ncbi:MAG: helix-turn-helix domain-containing protein, partial [bacterium]
MEADVVNSRIGKRIREYRHRTGLTQQELADRTELTKGYISQLEHGLVAPSVITLLDLIECLGSTPAEFFREEEPEMVVFSEKDFFEKIDDNGNSIQWI